MGSSEFPYPFRDQGLYFMQQSQVQLIFLCIIYSIGSGNYTVIKEEY